MVVHHFNDFDRRDFRRLHVFRGDTVASFASDTEIAFADKLRQQIEEQYLARTSLSLPWQLRSSEAN